MQGLPFGTAADSNRIPATSRVVNTERAEADTAVAAETATELTVLRMPHTPAECFASGVLARFETG